MHLLISLLRVSTPELYSIYIPRIVSSLCLYVCSLAGEALAVSLWDLSIQYLYTLYSPYLTTCNTCSQHVKSPVLDTPNPGIHLLDIMCVITLLPCSAPTPKPLFRLHGPLDHLRGMSPNPVFALLVTLLYTYMCSMEHTFHDIEFMHFMTSNSCILGHRIWSILGHQIWSIFGPQIGPF